MVPVIVGTVILCGCESCELYGPLSVQNGQNVTYVVDMEPYYSHANATVYVVAEIPEAWSPVGWSVEGTVDGTPVQGSGSWSSGDLGNCSKPVLPAGYRRVYAQSGPFAGLEPGRDQVYASLDFNTGNAEGNHRLTVWVEAVHDDGIQCAGLSPLTLYLQQWKQLEWEPFAGTGSLNPLGLGGIPGHFWSFRTYEDQFYAFFDSETGSYSNGLGAELWRTADFENWKLVRPAQEDEHGGTLIGLGDRLMFITADTPPGVPEDQSELWASDNGLDWTLLTTWIDWPFVVIDSPQMLAVVLLRGDAFDYELSLVTSGDGVTWNLVGGGPYTDESQSTLAGAFYHDELYLGGAFEDDSGWWHPRVWRLRDESLEIVDSTPLDTGNQRVMSMTVFDDRLVVGTSSDTGGEIWIFDDSTGLWQRVADSGFGLPGFSYVRDLAVHRGSMFALIWGDESQIWYANEAFEWSKSDLEESTAGSLVSGVVATGEDLIARTEFELWRRAMLFEDGFETGGLLKWDLANP